MSSFTASSTSLHAEGSGKRTTSSSAVPSSPAKKIGAGALAANVLLPMPSGPWSKMRSGLTTRPLTTLPSCMRLGLGVGGGCDAGACVVVCGTGQLLVRGFELAEARRVIERRSAGADVEVAAHPPVARTCVGVPWVAVGELGFADESRGLPAVEGGFAFFGFEAHD